MTVAWTPEAGWHETTDQYRLTFDGHSIRWTTPEETPMATYRITRFYQQGHPKEIIEEGLTLEEAQAHCEDPETSSRTATEAEGVERTERMGEWFDGYTEED